MNQNQRQRIARIERIFHPSDFSEASAVAFAHALKFALASKGILDIFHVTADADVDWAEFPGVRETLERWKLIPEGSPKSAVVDLGIDVRKAIAKGKDPVKACLDYFEIEQVDLVVLAVYSHEGRMRWLKKSVGEPIASASKQMTLFIPHGVEGFVSQQDGSVDLKEILIPIANKPRPQPSIEAAARLIRGLQLPPGNVTLLHVGEEKDMPSVEIPEGTDWKWNRVAKEGNPVETILHTAKDLNADLIVMTTDGPDAFLDGLRGTTSERVLHQALCPVAVLPVGSLLSSDD